MIPGWGGATSASRGARAHSGRAGPPEDDPYRVDGLSGATITSRGVSNLLAFWLGDAGFGPYLANFRNEKGI